MKPKPKKNLKEKNPLISDYKFEYFKWFITLSFSLFICLIAAKLIMVFYNPDTNEAIQYALKTTIIPGGFSPEPKEKLLYISSVLIFSVCFPLFYFLINKYLKNIKEKTIQFLYIPILILSVTSIIFLIYKGFAATNPFANNIQNYMDSIAKTNWDFYFITTFIYKNFYLFLFIIFPIILFTFLYDFKFSKKTSGIINKTKSIFSYSFCIALIIIVFFTASFKFPYTYENKYDFNAVYYSVVQVYHGMPMLVDNFTNTYGLYPHFITPFLKIFGLSILSFSSFMAFLVSLCFAFILIFLKKTIDNKFLILFGFTTIFFNCYMYIRIVYSYDAWFAMCPLRWFFPLLLVFYSVFYLKNKSKILYYLSFAVFSLGILWTPDFGMLTFISLVAFYCYMELENKNFKTICKKIFFHIFFSVIILIATFSLYSLMIKIFYGNFPEFLKMFSTLKVFSVIGFGMLPMPSSYHPWMFIALIYLIGLLYSVYCIINKKISPHSAVIFLLTVLGIGSFSYYLGRSHNGNLFPGNVTSFLLLTIFADDLFKITKKHKIFLILFALILFTLSFSFFQTIYDYKRINSLISETKNKVQNRIANDNISENAGFINKMTEKNEKILIFTASYYQGLYHGLSETSSAFNPGFIDLFLKEDYERILSLLIKNEKIKVFFDAETFRFYDSKIPVILSSLYNVKGTNGNMIFLEKKKENLNDDFILKQDKNDVIHLLVDKNLPDKLSFAQEGKRKFILGKQFSLELIFKPVEVPKSIFTNWATILCNSKDQTGFVLQQNDSIRSQYIFAIPEQGIICPVILNQWNYLSFEVNNKIIRAFANGKLIGSLIVKNDYLNNEEPLYLGNYKKIGGFFFGEIKEIKISNNLLDETEINLSWNKVKKMYNL